MGDMQRVDLTKGRGKWGKRGVTCRIESSARSWQRRVGVGPRKPLSLTSSTVSPMDSTCDSMPALSHPSAKCIRPLCALLRA